MAGTDEARGGARRAVTGSGPATLAEALDTLLTSGLLAPAEESIPDPVPYLDDMLLGWAGTPLGVIERTDALDFSDVCWDESVVIALVREIAALARIPCAEVR
ncbi:MAG TPA: hypothetical protein GX694_08160, partial [Actinomycetales bacterium]|nr:hypothetical protein [Actinomycetales bacterium]